MIRMEQPSLVLHSCDVPGYKYKMWKTVELAAGTTSIDVTNQIHSALNEATDNHLYNVIINCHGSPGFLHVGGSGIGFGTGSVSVLRQLKGIGTIGTIWLVACEVAKGEQKDLGKDFCSQLAQSANCDVVSSVKTQQVNTGFYLRGHPFGCIDKYEGLVYRFLPDGDYEVYKPKFQ